MYMWKQTKLKSQRSEILAHIGSISSTFYSQRLRAQIPKAPKDTDNLTEFLKFWDLQVLMLLINMLVKSTHGILSLVDNKLYIFNCRWQQVLLQHSASGEEFGFSMQVQHILQGESHLMCSLQDWTLVITLTEL